MTSKFEAGKQNESLKQVPVVEIPKDTEKLFHPDDPQYDAAEYGIDSSKGFSVMGSIGLANNQELLILLQKGEDGKPVGYWLSSTTLKKQEDGTLARHTNGVHIPIGAEPIVIGREPNAAEGEVACSLEALGLRDPESRVSRRQVTLKAGSIGVRMDNIGGAKVLTQTEQVDRSDVMRRFKLPEGKAFPPSELPPNPVLAVKAPDAEPPVILPPDDAEREAKEREAAAESLVAAAFAPPTVPAVKTDLPPPMPIDNASEAAKRILDNNEAAIDEPQPAESDKLNTAVEELIERPEFAVMRELMTGKPDMPIGVRALESFSEDTDEAVKTLSTLYDTMEHVRLSMKRLSEEMPDFQEHMNGPSETNAKIYRMMGELKRLIGSEDDSSYAPSTKSVYATLKDFKWQSEQSFGEYGHHTELATRLKYMWDQERIPNDGLYPLAEDSLRDVVSDLSVHVDDAQLDNKELATATTAYMPRLVAEVEAAKRVLDSGVKPDLRRLQDVIKDLTHKLGEYDYSGGPEKASIPPNIVRNRLRLRSYVQMVSGMARRTVEHDRAVKQRAAAQ